MPVLHLKLKDSINIRMDKNIHDPGKINLKPVKQATDCSHEDCDCELDAIAPDQELNVKWEFKPRQSPKWGVVEVQGLVVGRGKNKKVVPPDEVYRLAALGCDIGEMADWFGVNRETLKYNFSEYIAKGRADLKHRLRRAQIKAALSGNPALLIWLGKNLLSQQETPTSGEENQPLPWSDND